MDTEKGAVSTLALPLCAPLLPEDTVQRQNPFIRGTLLGLLGPEVGLSSTADSLHRPALRELGPQTVQLHMLQSWGRRAGASRRMLQQKEVSCGSLSYLNSQQVTCYLCPPSAQETSQSLILGPHIFARGFRIKTVELF